MSGGQIVGLWPEQESQSEQTAEAFEPEAAFESEQIEVQRPGRVIPVLLALLALGWLGFVGWSVWTEAAHPPRFADIAALVASASAPLALIGVLWLLLMRNSRREAQRFGQVAVSMRAESAALEAKVAELTARIDANRAALAEQADRLMSLGEDAAARLAGITKAMQSEAEAIDRHADTLKNSATAARADMAVLLASIPKAQVQTRQMVASLQEAGLGALEQAGALEAQLSSVIARGREADEVAGGAAQRLAAHLARMESTSETAGARLEEAAGQMSEAVDAALTRAADAVDEARRGMEAQGAAMLALVEQAQAALGRTGTDSVETMGQRVAAINAQVEALGASLSSHDETGRALLARLAEGLAEVEQRLTSLNDDGAAKTERLGAAIAVLGEHSELLAKSLDGAAEAADGFITRAEGLLTALDASAREIDETLPAALARLDTLSNASRERIDAMAPAVGSVEASATAALDRLAQTEKLLGQQRDAIEALGGFADRSFGSIRRGADELTTAVDIAQSRVETLADGAGPQLVEVMLRVRDAATQAAERARETLDRVVPDATAALGEAADAAFSRAIGERVEAQVASLARAAERAVEAANLAAERLGRQMASVTESAEALESQLAAAQEEAEDSNRETFARRVSLLMEALNSTAIDVTKILSNDVTDAAWAAYLKGDRGVFTRRAVRLLDAGESREILRHYEDEPEFRDQVNRYIHDFETMLRNVLATREGSQIGVTLLSSDMGKLYVALAQAIERLRT